MSLAKLTSQAICAQAGQADILTTLTGKFAFGPFRRRVIGTLAGSDSVNVISFAAKLNIAIVRALAARWTCSDTELLIKLSGIGAFVSSHLISFDLISSEVK